MPRILLGRATLPSFALQVLPERLPGTQMDATVLYIDHGDVITSTGTVSAIDACLHLVRKHLGPAIATRIARKLVIAPHREGGQAQYIERPLPVAVTGNAITEVLDWALGRIQEPLTVELLAAQAKMSHRSFVRRFRQTTGTTPARWVLNQRLQHARLLLESTDWSIDTVAGRCGFGSTATFRQNFVASFATTPSMYRRQFAPHS